MTTDDTLISHRIELRRPWGSIELERRTPEERMAPWGLRYLAPTCDRGASRSCAVSV